MPQALPHTDLISQQSSSSVKHRTLSAKFGDGYSQEVPDGINTKETAWDLVYENLTADERDDVTNALDAVGGWDHLTWQSKKWKVVDGTYQMSFSSGIHTTLSFSLREVP